MLLGVILAGWIVQGSGPLGCTLLAPCVEKEQFYQRKAELYCENLQRCDRGRFDESYSSIDDCVAFNAEGGQSYDEWQIEDKCDATINTCEAGRCLVVLASVWSSCDDSIDDQACRGDVPIYWDGACGISTE